MALIIPLHLSFRHQDCFVLASLAQHPEGVLYHLQFFDPVLQEVFETAHLRYFGPEGYRQLEQYEDLFLREFLDQLADVLLATIYQSRKRA